MDLNESKRIIPEDKIQEEFEKCFIEEFGDKLLHILKIPAEGIIHFNYEDLLNIYKAADLLPTEKVCPYCTDGYNRNPEWKPGDSGHYEWTCTTCDGAQVAQIYYTPEKYKVIMDTDFSVDAFVFTPSNMHYLGWRILTYGDALERGLTTILIVQTAQPAPPADYRPEE